MKLSKVCLPLCAGAVVVMAVACASKEKTGYSNVGDPVQTGKVAGEGMGSTAGSSPGGIASSEWPRVYSSGGVTNTLYQPQVEAWDGRVLTWRSAVAVQPENATQPVYGLLTLQATTVIDGSGKVATLENLRLTKAEFPSVPHQSDALTRTLAGTLSAEKWTMSVAAIRSNLEASQQSRGVPNAVNNNPPLILFSTRPAMLILVDGEPVYRPVTNTQLERIVNTRALVLSDKSGKHYLHLLDGYVGAPNLQGVWEVTAPPIGAPLAEKQARDSGQVDLLNGEAGGDQTARNLGIGRPPEIHVAMEPTELIVFTGPPDFVAIPGTQLLYVTNTTANVFKHLVDQQHYVLLSGRWFRASSLDGPWQFVAGDRLPMDFAQIPDSSPKENVKASVPGTIQAREALIANSISQNTWVARGSQMPAPVIDGEPRLVPISGTPLQYVENSGTPIIRVDEHSWYACQNGVWYSATSVRGPWFAAETVPAIIYSIPPSSPMHYVTYVKVYDSDSRVIYQGYTPGYLGTVVSDGVVMYGTGYYYTPWIGTAWYGPPVTWGYAYAPCWSPWVGWSFGVGFGWTYWGYYGYPYGWYGWPYPWWGPYYCYSGWGHSWHGHCDWSNTGANVYRPPVQAVRGGENRERAGYARAYNSRTGSAVAGEPATGVRNVFARGNRIGPIRQNGIPQVAGQSRQGWRYQPGAGGQRGTRSTASTGDYDRSGGRDQRQTDNSSERDWRDNDRGGFRATPSYPASANRGEGGYPGAGGRSGPGGESGGGRGGRR